MDTLFTLSEESPLKFGSIVAVPSIHSRVYFARAVRDAVHSFKPDVIAVEQPEAFTEALREAVGRLPSISLIMRSTDQEALYIPVDPADSIIEGVRMAVEGEIPFCCVDKDVPVFPENSRYLMPDDQLLMTIGLERYYTEITARHMFAEKSSVDEAREAFIAVKLAECARRFGKVLFIGGLSHWEGIKRHLRENTAAQDDDETNDGVISIHHLHRDSFFAVLGEMPYIMNVYELYRNGSEKEFNRLDLIGRIFYEARRNYRIAVPFTQEAGMMKYLRNLALLDRHITPDRIDILTAAKNFVNNEYALEVLKTLSFYSGHEADERYPDIKVTKDPLTDALAGYLKEKKITLNRRDHIWKTSLKKVSLTERPAERYEGEWDDVWRSSINHMSHIPEDIRMERSMDYLRTRIREKLGEERVRIHPFTASIEDGIDMRETIRNYHKHEIHVRDIPPVTGDVGPMVMIFDDVNYDEYPWRISWLSEAHDDSDLILYASEPGLDLVGPGISRCYFGGYASIMPPQNVKNVWLLYPILRAARVVANEAELLLYAGIIYSKEKYTGYCAPNPPSEGIKIFAAQKGVEIVYIPLASFASETVRKLRSFHVLGDKRLRDIAHHYII
ncbi:MAG: conjugal transfer protein TraB [Spirochaetes bacterium]|nr:conjugal transfer protein TraB [Spirochaetota bacterium]